MFYIVFRIEFTLYKTLFTQFLIIVFRKFSFCLSAEPTPKMYRCLFIYDYLYQEIFN